MRRSAAPSQQGLASKRPRFNPPFLSTNNASARPQTHSSIRPSLPASQPTAVQTKKSNMPSTFRTSVTETKQTQIVSQSKKPVHDFDQPLDSTNQEHVGCNDQKDAGGKDVTESLSSANDPVSPRKHEEHTQRTDKQSKSVNDPDDVGESGSVDDSHCGLSTSDQDNSITQDHLKSPKGNPEEKPKDSEYNASIRTSESMTRGLKAPTPGFQKRPFTVKQAKPATHTHQATPQSEEDGPRRHYYSVMW